MATGIVSLNPGSAIFPDGTASNLAPQLARVKSSAAAPSPYFYQINFDAAQLEQCSWQFVMPPNYLSSPLLLVFCKMTSATTGNIVMNARIAAITSGDAVDMDAKAYAAVNAATAAVPGTAGFVLAYPINLAPNADSLAAGDLVILYFGRDGANVGDTATGDLEVVGLSLTYTA